MRLSVPRNPVMRASHRRLAAAYPGRTCRVAYRTEELLLAGRMFTLRLYPPRPKVRA